ncbi:MAG TPA: helix-turn-helix domain-containing protein [Erythrobacter sp.]|nr:helix-turn-helix domain-containing protein [Erythrobacter sp.]
METEYDDSADSASEPPVSGAGAQLRAAREALHRDLPSVAAETRIPLRHLQAIEDGNFEALPSRAYAIGFARTYAKVVGLNSAEITDVVRSELAEGSMQRAAPSSAMEPGDPGRLPSSGLAWASALAALVLAVGGYAFYNAYFGAGTQPGTLLTPETTVTPAPVASGSPTTEATSASSEVVLTAMEDGIWLRLYEEGGARLIERTLKKGETVLVPVEASDPRINTGRPDALAITVGGKSVAKLSDRATTLSGVAVSAAALLARSAATAEVAAASPITANPVAALPIRRSDPVAPARREATPDTATAPAPNVVAEVPPGTGAAENTDN